MKPRLLDLLIVQHLKTFISAERSISQVKYELEALEPFLMEVVSPAEFDFWEELRTNRLLPDSQAFAHDQDLRGEMIYAWGG